ncbi:MAG: DUF6788 family protein [Candidatus Bipolaricaulia bacterium]
MARLHKIAERVKSDLGRLTLGELYDVDGYLHQLLEELDGLEIEEIPVKAGREVVEVRQLKSCCYRLERVRCGKPNCKCTKGELHGPYWYAYWREGKRVRSGYVGKSLPGSDGG